jgi:CBS domain-containing protein
VLITFRDLSKYYAKEEHLQNKETMVKSLIESKPICMEPEATGNIAFQLMKKHMVDCLPVVKKDRLIGI